MSAKNKTRLLSNVLWLVAISCLVGYIIKSDAGLLRIGVLLTWIWVVLSVIAGIFIGALSATAKEGKNAEALLNALEDIDSRSSVRKAWSWFQCGVLIGMLAYCGALVTACVYIVATGWMQLNLSLARDKAKELRS
ncbi:hypothetical protein [Pseudomonas sp.]|uniref:hypothetical protein n=1 Tax=Pseudomonas sp. TaxID=306 RepID=UPI00289A7F4D|nr:hypothetical protein [Pseudomonas sp.]